MTTRADVVRVARSYIGTPFHHMGRVPGVGLDCVGVLICAARELGLIARDFDLPAYTPSPDGVTMLKWADEYMTKIPQSLMQAGDVLMLITDAEPQHLAILADYVHGGLSIVHSANSATPPRVLETRLMFSRVQRFAGAYVLPNIE